MATPIKVGARVKLSVATFVTIGTLLARPGFAQESAAPWITDEKLATVSAIGIDPTKDLEAKGNYHWRYRASRPLAVSGYSCPIGSMVGISRNIILVLPPENAACRDAKGGDVRALRLLPNGSAEAM
jgi:hypothetical protein